jgi:hypothetical protein
MLTTLRAADSDRRASGVSPAQWVQERMRARSRVDANDVVADCAARMRARMRMQARQAAHDDYESGGDVFSFSPSPGPGIGEGEVADVRPLFDEGRSAEFASPPLRVEPPQTASAASSTAGGREGYGHGRDALTNARISAHECGHAACGLSLGAIITMVTIVPDNKFAGKTTRSGPRSASYPETDDPPKSVGEIVRLANELAALPRVFGASRAEDAEGIVRMQNSIVELLAGEEAERFYYPRLAPLGAEGDMIEAKALASAIAVSPSATAALISYCRAEARGIIEANADIVEALASELISRGTLHEPDIEEIVADVLGARSQLASAPC